MDIDVIMEIDGKTETDVHMEMEVDGNLENSNVQSSENSGTL